MKSSSRAFRPRATIERYSKDHAKYVHGAWKTGVLDDLMRSISERSGEAVPPDLSLDEIKAIFTALAGSIDLSVVIAPVPSRGNIPVGLVGVASGKHWSEPHVIWFPWASKRNRYEGIASIIENRRNAFIIAGDDERFWKRLSERKLVKRLGTLNNVTLWGCEWPAR